MDLAVALACVRPLACAVDDDDAAPLVADEFRLLQFAGGYRDTFAAHADRARQRASQR
jgi:hypothetical protein